ncbi:hypothetical protein [Halanaerobacter jeridensis]|uniref:Membrane protein n=1 Tax=Halanaerobacter jeridensis TaxID=706427 RepID=A0A939BSA2_9FIRM|nr:hypothetical protein [Halanaerobacter jeridensis]MBM7558144.1 putative membrane protein [Halanaerobacter jeridensis]
MKKRPRSITIIAWLIIGMAVITLATTTITLLNPEFKKQSEKLMKQNSAPLMVQYILMYLGAMVSFVSGVAMINAKNWGRILYVGWSGLSLLFGFFTSPAKGTVIPSLIFTLVIIFFLFRDVANKYFTDAKVE